MANPWWKIVLRTLVKVGISALALYLVYRKIDVKNLINILSAIHAGYFAVAVVLANMAQWVSAIRLRQLLGNYGLRIGFWYNLRLYYIGMFYNLFLPGGIGGDGAKAVLLQRRFGKPLKNIVGILFLDRLTGLCGMLFIGLITLLFSQLQLDDFAWRGIAMLCALAIYPVFYVFLRLADRSHQFRFIPINSLGLANNLLQAGAVVFLFWSLGVDRYLVDYLAVFFAANLMLLVPVTVGGIGARELVFLSAPALLPVEQEVGVTFSILFLPLPHLVRWWGCF